MAFCLIAVLSYSQTITINNTTGGSLFVGVQVGPNPAICSWFTAYNGITIPTGTTTLPIGAVNTTYRVGAGATIITDWDVCPFWNPACYNNGGTTYTFTWVGCNNVTIN